jgi:hypothetical protein
MRKSSFFGPRFVVSMLAIVALFGGGCASHSSPTKESADSIREPASVSKEIEFHEAEKNGFAVGDLNLKTYSLASSSERRDFKAKLKATVEKKDDRMPDAGAVALEESIRLLDQMDQEKPTAQDLKRLQETIEGYNSNFLSPVPTHIWIGALPFKALEMIHHSIMNKKAPEAIDVHSDNVKDLSKVDPAPSSFWKPGRNLDQINMYYGFDRKEIPTIATDCTYSSPKKSYGRHGGFKVECAKKKWKIKFGEESKTEPFISRLVWALGFNATVIDYLPAGVKVAYDRDLITEYESRKPLVVKVKSALGFTYLSKDLQATLNPFNDCIDGAELIDGTRLTGQQLQAKLVRSIPQKGGKDDWSKAKDIRFNEKFEKQVKNFILKEGSLEGSSPKDLQELGSWSWNSIDHPEMRAMRAFGILMAFINGPDMRQNNNKVFLRTLPDGSSELNHEVSDLGSGLGTASGAFHYIHGDFENLPWDVVRHHDDSSDDAGAGWMPSYDFPSYSVIEDNQAFSNIQPADAKWMMRKIAALSEAQIQDALIAAGLTAAETKLVFAKLIARRSQMINVFGLASEFPEIAHRKIDRSMDYDPRKDPLPEAKEASVPTTAPKSHQRIENGHLIK